MKASDLWKGWELCVQFLVCTDVLRVSDHNTEDKEWKARGNKQAQAGIAVWELLMSGWGFSKYSPFHTVLLCSEASATKEIVMDIFHPRTPRKEQPLFVRHCEETSRHLGHCQCVPDLCLQHTSPINIIYRGSPFPSPTANVLLQGHRENARTHHNTLHDVLWNCIVLALCWIFI